jgi:hypothetical protein
MSVGAKRRFSTSGRAGGPVGRSVGGALIVCADGIPSLLAQADRTAGPPAPAEEPSERRPQVEPSGARYRIDMDQEAMVLFPLYFGNVGMRPRTQFANEPLFWPFTFTAETLPVPRTTKSTLISLTPGFL